MKWTSEMVRTMRKHVGMTQLEFANAIGCAPNSVSLWERDEVAPSRLMSRVLTDVFGRPDQKSDGVAA